MRRQKVTVFDLGVIWQSPRNPQHQPEIKKLKSPLQLVRIGGRETYTYYLLRFSILITNISIDGMTKTVKMVETANPPKTTLPNPR